MVGINANLTSTLFGGSLTNINPKASDVLTGGAKGGLSSAVSASLSASLGGASSNLSASQKSSFSNLESYINDNVGDDAIKAGLLKDLSAIENILETGDSSASLDPVFSLLAGLSEINEGNSSAGLLVDSIL